MKWKIKMFQTTNQKKKHDAENAWKNDGFLVEYRKKYIYIYLAKHEEHGVGHQNRITRD